MALGYFGFYVDAAKVTTIIISGGNFLSTATRKDYQKGGYYRLTDGTLETWNEHTKYEEVLSLSEISETDKDTLETEYDLHRSFYYYPDVANRATEYYQVKWTGVFNAVYNKRTKLYSLKIILKEV